MAQGAIINKVVLAAASFSGNLDSIKYLLAKNADIDAKITLAIATKIGDLEVVKYLVQNVNNLSNCRYALIYALRYGHLDIAEYLLDNGADIDDKVPILV